MKRTLCIFIFILSFLTACNLNNDTTILKDGAYVLEHIEKDIGLLPCVTISEGDITFQYDMLSSYIAFGSYTIKNDILTMVTNDGLYKYVFKVDGDNLFFIKNQSSTVKLTDSRFGVKITDNAKFKLKVE